MNKTDLLQKVKALDGLTQDERSYLINLVNNKKKYGLVWEDKPEDVEELLRENLPVLKEVKDKAIINGDEHPNHILIEGDNLHALTALTFTHEGKIDVIYIDPPYNTGNKDFKYNDSFVDKEDSYRHSKWLSFISKRLIVARRLLSDNGVIFISIDDNENAQLKLLCDEIFVNENFVTELIWQKKTGASDAKTIDTICEYVLVYTKSTIYQTKLFARNSESYDINRYKHKDDFFDTRGPYYLDTLDRGGLRYSDSLNYPIECPDGTITYPNGRTQFVNDGWTFKWGQEKLKWGLDNKFIEFRKNPKKESGWTVCYKNYLYVDNEGALIERSAPLKNMILDIKNADGASNIKDIFGHQLFKYSKPVKLITRILSYISSNNPVILDFFAGSGTTLHATMALNAEDSGCRQCILVTNNENSICEDVTYERNKRVIEGYTNVKGVDIEGLVNNNLRYYKSEFVSREPSLKNKRELTQLATELLCIKENCYNEQKIHIKQARLFANAQVTLLILFDDHIIPEAVEFIKGIKAPEIKVYVFSMGSDPYTEDFAEVLDKITLCALPDAIYKAYQNVLPKKNKIVPTIEEEDSETHTNESGEQLSIL